LVKKGGFLLMIIKPNTKTRVRITSKAHERKVIGAHN
jgi:hypothetical protein